MLRLKQNAKLADDLRRIGLGKFVDSPRLRRALGLPVHEMPKPDPEILELSRQVRELIKGGQKSAAAKLLDESQLKVDELSAQDALEIARIAYESGRLWLGDAALRRAKSQAPDAVKIYDLEAKNQAWRGTLNIAIDAGHRVLELLSDDATAKRKRWSRFLGDQYMRLANYADAVTHYSQGGSMSDETRYKYAVALEAIGDGNAAQAQYVMCAKTLVPAASEELRVAELHLKMHDHARAVAATREVTTLQGLRLRARAQLLDGQYEQLISQYPHLSHDPEINECVALALELRGENAAAKAAYLKIVEPTLPPLPALASTGIVEMYQRNDSSDRPSLKEIGVRHAVLERYARAAYRAGDWDGTVRAGAALISIQSLFEGLDVRAEVDPSLGAIASEAFSHLMANDRLDEAAVLLEQALHGCSSEKNLVLISRALAWVYSRLGLYQRAAEYIAWSLPSLSPYAAEANRKIWPLQTHEAYFDASDNLPVTPNVVLYESFHGEKTGCNPLAMCLEMLSDASFDHLHHIWAVRRGAEIHPSLLGRSNVHFVEYQSFGYARWLATAGYLVNNTSFPHWFIRRQSQRYANTWHGTPWKYMGRDIREDGFSFQNVARNLLQATDLFLPNEHTSKSLIEKQDIAGLLQRQPHITGSPRVDVTLRTAEKPQDVLHRLSVGTDRLRVLYAPTWRGKVGAVEPDTQPFVDAILELAGRDVEVLVRIHHFVEEALTATDLPSNVTVVSASIDTNELLGVTDILVTDYSSILFDFLPLNRPLLKYMFDLDAYEADRGLYFRPGEVPGESCTDLRELGDALDRVIEGSQLQVNAPADDVAALWACEDGAAGARAIEILMSPLAEAAAAPPPRHLLSVGGLQPNGITRSFRNLLRNLGEDGVRVQVLLPKRIVANEEPRALAAELSSYADFTIYYGNVVGTRMEKFAWKKYLSRRTPVSRGIRDAMRSQMSRLRRLYFSDVPFASVIDFDGHFPDQAALIALGFPEATPSVYIAHSEFCREMDLKFPGHQSTAQLFTSFDRVASVSDSVRLANSEGLAARFDTPESVHVTLPNTIDVNDIVERSKEPVEDDIREWLALPGPHITVVARFSVEKNHEMAIAALAEAHARGVKARLLFLGEGALKQRAIRQVEKLGLGEFVFFAGQRTNPYAVMAHVDGVLLPSKHEGQGLVLIEAMTLGVPVAATNIPGPASVIADPSMGLLVEPTLAGIADAICALGQKSVPVAVFDASQYQRDAVEAFYSVVAPIERASDV